MIDIEDEKLKRKTSGYKYSDRGDNTEMECMNGYLKLAYSPMTGYEFDKYHDDVDIRDFLQYCNLYMIVEKPLVVMHLVKACSEGIHLRITMRGVKEECEILFLVEDNPKLLHGFNAMRMGNNTTVPEDFHSITLYRNEEEFIMSANFERLVHLNTNGIIKLRVKGNFDPFLTYKVLYVGQCTSEHIFERFKTHHAYLEILVKEQIISQTYDKINDIMILPFRMENDLISIINGNSSITQYHQMFSKKEITEKTIALDCEKALIKAMTPKYNKILFNNYPKSEDGLYNFNLSLCCYRILELMLLEYGEEKYIFGDVDAEKASILTTVNNEIFTVI